MLLGGTLTCAQLRRGVRPAARRALRRRRRACSSSRCRCCATAAPCGSRWPRDLAPRACGAGRVGRAARRPRERRRAPRRHVRAVPDRHRRGPPPPAAPRRAAHRLRVRDVLVAALGRPGVPPARRADAVARRLRPARRAVGGVPDPDRPGLPHAHERDAAAIVALYPSPAGATESELELAAWDALCAANPVLDRLEPDAEALIVNRLADRAAVRDRPDRPVLPARRADQVALGGHHRRARRRGRGRPSSSTRCARGRWR